MLKEEYESGGKQKSQQKSSRDLQWSMAAHLEPDTGQNTG